MKKITFDSSRCVACHACTIACIDQNDTSVEEGQKALRRAGSLEIREESGQTRFAFFSSACRHCEDAPCIMACPFGAPRYRPGDGKMVKCDGCYIRQAYGMEPACVRACAFGALKIL